MIRKAGQAIQGLLWPETELQMTLWDKFCHAVLVLASGIFIACLILVAMTSSGCSLFARQPPPASVVCPAAAMALRDTTSPPIPEQMAADDAIDRAIYHVTQRNECAELNAAKLACLTQSEKKPK